MLPFFASKKLAAIAYDSVHADISQAKRLNQGFYGYVYLLKDRKDRRFVAKVFKNIGYMAREEAQLNMLRKYALVHVPEIIGKSGKMQNGAFDVLFMEYIHGVNASRLHLLSASDKARFADEVVDNLLTIHSISSPQGFGDFVDCYIDSGPVIFQIRPHFSVPCKFKQHEYQIVAVKKAAVRLNQPRKLGLIRLRLFNVIFALIPQNGGKPNVPQRINQRIKSVGSLIVSSYTGSNAFIAFAPS